MSQSTIQVELSAYLDYISKSPFETYKTYQSAPSKLCSSAFYQKAFHFDINRCMIMQSYAFMPLLFMEGHFSLVCHIAM